VAFFARPLPITVSIRFEQVAAALSKVDVATLWAEADDQERRALVDELLEAVAVIPDDLEVTVAGAPPLTVLFSEVGLKESEIVRVGEAFPTFSTRPVWHTQWAA